MVETIDGQTYDAMLQDYINKQKELQFKFDDEERKRDALATAFGELRKGLLLPRGGRGPAFPKEPTLCNVMLTDSSRDVEHHVSSRIHQPRPAWDTKSYTANRWYAYHLFLVFQVSR